MEEKTKKEAIEVKDMFVKSNTNGDLQIRVLPINAPPYIIDTNFNIKDLLKRKIEEMANKFEDEERKQNFIAFGTKLIEEEYKRVTSFLDIYTLENCCMQEVIGKEPIAIEEIDNLSKKCLESLFDSMYEEQLETYILTVFIGECEQKQPKYYLPRPEQICVKDKITKNTKRVTYYNCEHCIEEGHLKGLLGNVMIRYFCEDCNCEIVENKAIQYGDKKAYYHRNCLTAKLRKKRDLKREDIQQIIDDNEIPIKKFYCCSKCGIAIKGAVVKYNKKMYDEKCFRALIEKEKGYKLTEEQFEEIIEEYQI